MIDILLRWFFNFFSSFSLPNYAIIRYAGKRIVNTCIMKVYIESNTFQLELIR